MDLFSVLIIFLFILILVVLVIVGFYYFFSSSNSSTSSSSSSSSSSNSSNSIVNPANRPDRPSGGNCRDGSACSNRPGRSGNYNIPGMPNMRNVPIDCSDPSFPDLPYQSPGMSMINDDFNLGSFNQQLSIDFSDSPLMEPIQRGPGNNQNQYREYGGYSHHGQSNQSMAKQVQHSAVYVPPYPQDNPSTSVSNSSVSQSGFQGYSSYAPANAPANAPGQVNPRVQSNQSAYQGYGSYTAVNPANAAANAPGQANAAANDPFNNTVNVSSNYRQSTVRNSTFQGYNGPTFSISDSADQIYYDDDIQRRFDALTFSSESPDDGVVSPFVLKDEKFISKNCPEGIVVDVSTFSSSILFLMKTGRIIRKKISDGSKDVVTSNIRAKRLESFAGYLYAIADGVIYQLNNTSYDSNNWEWKLCSWAPTGVIYTSTNPTKTLLWIQTANNAYLYDKSLTAITTLRFSSGLRRNYGTNQDEYIDYDPDTCRGTLTRNGEKSPLSDVCSVVFDQYGQPIPLNKNESVRHREIRILNWKPYYIPRDTS